MLLRAPLATVLVLATTAACSKSTPSSASPDASADAAPASGVLCDEATTLAAIDRIAKASFPDNPDVTWRVLGHKTVGLLRYIEVEPTPDEVGYPKFILVIGCSVATEPEIRGGYAFENGSYILLFTADGTTLPASPP
jgi:hypothetical protein